MTNPTPVPKVPFGTTVAAHTQLLLKIAWRNVWLHKAKSLIIGVILMTGTVVMTVGNATISGMDKGLEKNMMDGLIGHLLVISKTTDDKWALFGNMGTAADLIQDFDKVQAVVTNDPDVTRTLPMNQGLFLMVLQAESASGHPPMALPVGVQFHKYVDMFSNLSVIAGRGLKPGETGLVMNHANARTLYKTYGTIFAPAEDPFSFTNYLPPEACSNLSQAVISTDMILVGISDKKSTLDIKVPIVGVWSNRNFSFGDQGIDILDLKSYREGMNYSLGDEEVVLSSNEQAVLTMSEDDLFGSTSVTGTGGAMGMSDLKTLLVKKTAAAPMDLDKGGNEIISVKIRNTQDIGKVTDRLNKTFTDKGLKAKAIDWRKAAGTMASFVSVIRMALWIFVAFVFFVAGIVIVNTLAMTTMERASELGMMRAVGAQRGFLGEMLLTETFVLAAVFGTLGMALGAGIVQLLLALQIQASPGFMTLLFGGSIFHPIMGPRDYISGTVLLILVTLLSVLYPARLAKRITALDAVTRD